MTGNKCMCLIICLLSVSIVYIVLEGGPLNARYKLEQFHCHWGKDETEGSEHTVDGNTYPAEVTLITITEFIIINYVVAY